MTLTGWTERFVGVLTALSALALASMVLLTVADVLAANFFHRPIVGTFDLVQALLAFIVFLGIPQIFFIEGNITVDVIDHVLRPRGVAFLRMTGGILSLTYLGLLWWHMFQPAIDTFNFGDVTPDLSIPVFIIWLPVLFGMAVALVATAFVIVRQARHFSGVGRS